MDKSNQSRGDLDDSHNQQKGKKSKQQFKCGEAKCQKLYHSYTAFYNHCKKAHNGQFPPSSLFNNQIFEGPTKNRGRPRIKKSQVKNQFQIQSMKAQNQLIQFMGTIKTNINRANQQLISYVQDPAQRIIQAVTIVKQWRAQNTKMNNYLDQLIKVNTIICQNDLPQFYDPIQFQKYQDRVDSYNFTSIYNFFKKSNIVPEKPQMLLICWLARILSLKLLSQTIYMFIQRYLDNKINDQKQLFQSKSTKFMQLADGYLELVKGEYNEENLKE